MKIALLAVLVCMLALSVQGVSQKEKECRKKFEFELFMVQKNYELALINCAADPHNYRTCAALAKAQERIQREIIEKKIQMCIADRF